jgi:hypothetical protein
MKLRIQQGLWSVVAAGALGLLGCTTASEYDPPTEQQSSFNDASTAPPAPGTRSDLNPDDALADPTRTSPAGTPRTGDAQGEAGSTGEGGQAPSGNPNP